MATFKKKGSAVVFKKVFFAKRTKTTGDNFVQDLSVVNSLDDRGIFSVNSLLGHERCISCFTPK